MNRPCVEFITTMRHPADARDYDRVEGYLRSTLHSVCNQKHNDFSVTVVCNQVPSFAEDLTKVRFLQVFLPAPSAVGLQSGSMEAIRLDRGCKHALALAKLRETGGAKFVMFFDADDLLSNRIVSHVSSNSERAGFFAESGWSMTMGQPFLNPVTQFWTVNGNANILPFAFLDRNLSAINAASTRDEILENVDRNFLKKILGSHKYSKDYFAEIGLPLEPLPFRPAIWLLGNFENHSDLYGVNGGSPIRPEQIAEFSVPETYLSLSPGNRLRRLWFRGLKFIRRFGR